MVEVLVFQGFGSMLLLDNNMEQLLIGVNWRQNCCSSFILQFLIAQESAE